ncbi:MULTISPECIES: phytanoyl-CoA dioxygenase family protein [unclassified Siphonobacter]|uniref:phytanoyl-CoA dioxygenase family protein n=1 Tax=unclassified Siphonobacter TaxID=2635712 RepID=UPI002789153E|nr:MULTISPECIES: phytanoyl-CoA dioxygenase family protein [unclassified Siphonobacter]MDQ1089975.1 phytanoyl-CoA hydroxylase [Siphonobacter sp. SORGH_AS_1065]MDR6197480.1 phytanoyl-CoA hydroxylase [Siphonobacter sp. SORGH_AS_0500]
MSQTFVFNKALTEEQRQYFKTHGIIQFKQFVDRATVQEFIREVNRVEQHLLKTNTEKVNGIPLKFGENERGDRMIQRLAFTSHYSQKLRDFLRDPRFQLLLELLGPYEGRIGENEKDGLVVNHYVNTPTSQFKQLGWHTDSPRDLFLGTRIQPMLNVGLHLDDCSQANGGLRVLTGTHEQSIWKLLFRKKYFIDNNPDPKETGFEIEAGDLTIHDGRLWHRVQQSPFIGEKSRRRVMYIPIITGEYSPKHAESPTPFYHKLGSIKLPKPSLSGWLNKNWQPGIARFLS